MKIQVPQIRTVVGISCVILAIFLIVLMILTPWLERKPDDQKIHNMMGISMILDVSTDGKHVHQVGNSWLRQMLPLFWAESRLCTTSCVQIRDTSNTLRSPCVYGVGYKSYHWLTDSATQGIVVGSGSTAVTFSDYKLETIIGSGSGSGQLTYNASVWQAMTTPTDSSSWQVTRTFTNNSGSTITVREVGIYMESGLQAGGSINFCGARDVLAEAVEVEALHVLTVTYTIQMTLE